MTNYNHRVCVFNHEGKMTYEECFSTAEQAWEEWKSCVRCLKEFKEESGRIHTVIRFNGDTICSFETI